MRTYEEALRSGRATLEEALRLFDGAETADIEFMIGTWRGSELPTGHPLDGLMEASGWYGKRFVDAERVHPLLFYAADCSRVFPVDPARVPVGLILGLPLPRTRGLPYHQLVLGARPLVRTAQYKARLRMTEYRGRLSATMIYDDKPINDVFRKLDDHTVLGAMDRRGDKRPYFFLLRRDAGVTVE